ncbi:MAG: ABC transporter permease subunit [Deltaproteobacteria bacterium]|nr:ABC transporter permease subunit [Deltaproteobacteria bacterium]
MNTSTSPARATIHELGYEPYRGVRVPPTLRFLAISHNLVTVAWRSRWGVKAPIFLAAIITVAFTGGMYLGKQVESHLSTQGVPMLRADAIIYQSLAAFRFVGFLLALTAVCPAVADDLKAGAFQFYFSRPIRPRDYVLGKVLGASALVGIAMLAGPLVLSLLRLAMAKDGSDLARHLPLFLRALASGAMSTPVYVLIPLAIGAWVKNRRVAQGLFAIYTLALGNTLVQAGEAYDQPLLRLASVDACLDAVSGWIFGIDPRPEAAPAWASALSLVALGSLAAWLVLRQVKRAERSGVGGGS